VHILDGLLIALTNLDEVIRTIRQSNDSETAKSNLVSRFNLTEIQAQAILDMQLRRLSALERQKIEEEHQTGDGSHCLSGRLACEPQEDSGCDQG